MKQHSQQILSPAFNTSMGFIPILVSIALGELISQDIAIYIGAAIGIIELLRHTILKRRRMPNFILYASTGVLILFSLGTLLPADIIPEGQFPITIEIALMIVLAILYGMRRTILLHFSEEKTTCPRFMSQGAEASIVSMRMALLLGILHLIIIGIVVLFSAPDINPGVGFIVLHLFPFLIFLTCIILNYYAIKYFNHLMQHVEYLPIVNNKGDVIGKTISTEVIKGRKDILYPVIRVAVVTHGMLFLCQRPEKCLVDGGKVDLPAETILHYGETLPEALERVLPTTLSNAEPAEAHFSLMHEFENDVTRQLIYLYIYEVEDDSVLCSSRYPGSKLWTFEQIKDNLGKNYFADCFEEEFEHLKEVIYIREKYKES